MANSMTGFGRGKSEDNKYSIVIEAKSVNHRYMETHIRIPRSHHGLEEQIRRVFQSMFSRGKFEIFVQIKLQPQQVHRIRVNFPLLEGYLEACSEIRKKLMLSGELKLENLLQLDGIFQPDDEEDDPEQLTFLVIKAVNKAVEELKFMREKEGEELTADLKSRLDSIEQEIDEISKLSVSLPGIYREKLNRRIEELLNGQPIDENRIALEILLFTDKSSIDEEIIRFHSHIRQFRTSLDKKDPVGRRLDFLVQEMNREVNTIGSKANDLGISQYVVNIKTEIEKIREQIQNIE